MFFCGPDEDAQKRTPKLDDLKQLTETIQNKMLIPCALACCPGCTPPAVPEKEPEPEPPLPPCPQPPDIMICYKTEKVERKRTKTKKDNGPKRTKRAKSRELRASILYTGCNCEKRDGLQDDCPRTGCHGSPECLTKPNPICGPSEFSNGKHLGKKLDKHGNKKEERGDESERVTYYYNCYPATLVA